MPIAEVIVGSWNELHDILFADSWNAEIGRFRSSLAFRGLSDATYRLETTLMRLGGDYCTLERHLLRNFRKYAHRQMVDYDSIWHWVATAQHHGLPTRLLDWTYSPLVAMHFATANVQKMDRDSAIWAVDYVQVNRSLADPLRQELVDEGSNVFTVELLRRLELQTTPHDDEEGALRRIVNSLEAFGRLTGGDFLLFLEPPSMDDRIVNQFALFSVMSNPRTAIDDHLRQHPAITRKIVIPKKLKWEIRDKLDQANITERVLFPGLDGLTQWLKRHYSPRD